MRHGLDVCIAAALWAGAAIGLFVSGGCVPLISADVPARLDGWLEAAGNSPAAADAEDGGPAAVTLTDSPGGTGDEFLAVVGELAVAEESPAVESVSPSPADEMTVADVMAYALQHHPALQLREQEIQLALARVTAAGLLPNPQLVLDAETELRDAHTTDLTGRLMFTVPTGPKRRLRTAAAQAAVQAGRAALCRETKAVLAEVTDAAVAVLYWQERVALERHSHDLASQAAEIRRELFRIGAVPYRDTVAMEMTLTDAVLAERDAASQLRLAQLRLARAMAVEADEAPVLRGQLEADPLPAIPLDDVLARARSVSPELARAGCDLAASHSQLAYENCRSWPDLSLGPRFRDAFADDPDRIGARVAVDLPLFDRNQANIAAASAQVQSSLARRRLAELETLGDVAESYLELRAVDAGLEYHTRHVLPLAEHTAQTLQQAFRESAVGAAELVDMLQQAELIRKRHLALRWQHVRLQARLEIFLEQRLTKLAAMHDGPPAQTRTPAASERRRT